MVLPPSECNLNEKKMEIFAVKKAFENPNLLNKQHH